MDSLMSREICIEILARKLCTSENINYISSELKPISEDAEGFMGEHYKLNITYELGSSRKTEAFFVKNKPRKNKVQEEMANSLELYKREIFLYDVLVKEFEKFEYDTSFVAKSYYCIPDQTLIIEDVTLKGFSITERGFNLTMDHLKCALKSLAMYHGSGYAYERTKSKHMKKKFVLGQEYKEYLKEAFYIQYIDQSLFAMKWWNSSYKTLNVLIDLLPHDDVYKQEFKKLIENAEVGKAFVTETNINKTCGHGDLWSNNMLFKYQNNVPVQCCLVDFQICRYFYPCFDILLAIYCNTSSEFRKQHLEKLFLYYHNTLAEILKNYGFSIEEIYPLKDFYKSIELVKVDALMQVLLTNVIVNLPKEKLTDFVNDDEAGLTQVMFENDVMAAEAFQTDEDYRNIISDTIYELRDALLTRRH